MLLKNLIQIRFKPKMWVIFLSLFLAACSKSLHSQREVNGDESYINAPKLKALKSAQGLILPPERIDYSISDLSGKGAIGKKVDIRPPVQILTLFDGSYGKYIDGTSTLFLEGNPSSRLWLEVLNVVKKNNLPIVQKQERDHRLTTDWIIWNQMDRNSLFSGRYEISLNGNERQKLLTVKTLELHQGDKKVDNAVDIERYNNTLLNTLIKGLYQIRVDAENAQAAHKSGVLDVQSGSDETGLPNIVIRAPYTKVWELLPPALKKIGMVITQSRRSEGILWVKYKAVSDDQQKKMKVKKTNLAPGEYKLQLADLGNRSSLQFLHANGQTLIQSQNDALVPVLETVFNQIEATK